VETYAVWSLSPRFSVAVKSDQLSGMPSTVMFWADADRKPKNDKKKNRYFMAGFN
jgi:hypothetical protein